MIYPRIVFIILFLISYMAATLDGYEGPKLKTYTHAQFQDYWYNHGAEISRFDLRQMRYGEIHDGDAVLIFVTEKMNPDIQIKTQMNLNESTYQVNMHSYFEKVFPYRIQQWEQTYRGLTGSGAKVMTTRATRTHTIMEPYWQHHQNKDRGMLTNLGLHTREMFLN